MKIADKEPLTEYLSHEVNKRFENKNYILMTNKYTKMYTKWQTVNFEHGGVHCYNNMTMLFVTINPIWRQNNVK